MKYLLFLMFVTAATAAFVPFAASTGKPLDACIGRSNRSETYNVPHETDCHKFYKCLGDYAFEVDCPTLKGIQLFFNAELQVCDWDSTNCQNNGSSVTMPSEGPSSSTPSSSTPNIPDADCATDPDKKWPYPGDKHKYYECENGRLVVGTCLEGHYFNPIVGECDIE